MKRKDYRISLQICILVAAFAQLFGGTIVKLVQDWYMSDNYSHGFLVPLISGYMIWQKKDQLSNLSARSNKLGILLLILGMLVFILWNVGAELFTMRIAMIITIAGLCTYLFGTQVALAIAVPLVYLIFMIPLPAIVWSKIAFPLQLFAAKLTSKVVQLMGIPILREGNVLYLSNTTLEVVDACSGLRSLTSMMALSAAFGYLARIATLKKWILFISAIPIAIFVNIIRLTSTALMARYISPRTAQDFLHNLSGILVFIVAIIILFGMYAVLHKQDGGHRK